jgi:hypothetical protein
MSKSMQERFSGALCNSSSILTLDTFPGYLHEKLKVKLEGKICVSVIPSGVTSQLIPINVLVSQVVERQFKDGLRGLIAV